MDQDVKALLGDELVSILKLRGSAGFKIIPALQLGSALVPADVNSALDSLSGSLSRTAIQRTFSLVETPSLTYTRPFL